MKVIISGATGFIGRHLVALLISGGHEVTVWTRKPQEEKRAGVGAYHWDPVSGQPQIESLEGVDTVVHLAGEPVSQRWSDEVKRKIRDSRIIGTRNLVSAIGRMSLRPKALVCGSAIGFYGNRGEEELTESSPPGDGFLPQVSAEWEREADRAAELGLRVAKVRTGVVLGDGGALEKMLPAFRAGAGGKLVSGNQWMSWIHITDLARIFQFAIENPIEGPINGTAPKPVRNVEFTAALAKALDRPALLTIPELALRMMFGEMAGVLIESQRVLPQVAESSGFIFNFPEVAGALTDLLGKHT